MMRQDVRFYLGDEHHVLDDLDPALTLLDWLRQNRGRTGTKEGCNEGDCGACTVVVVRREGERLTWRAVNACIQVVAMMDGAQILTVEDLAEGDVLHPVQQAMIDQHGSQCGFCTPGFVMSMMAYRKARDASVPGALEDEARIDEALAGNLCRCTGYTPIVRAMKQALEAGPDRFDAMESRIFARLDALADGADVEMAGAAGRLSIPASVDRLARVLEDDPAATLVAGATDVGLWITKGLRPLPHLVFIGQVPELRAMQETEDGLRIGAAVPYDSLRAALSGWLPGADEVIGRLGSTQVRNVGTIGGNIANGSPIGDGPPLLIAAGAILHLRRGNRRRSMPLEAFFIAYGQQDRHPEEFVEAITIPAQPQGRLFRAYKISKRRDQDISAVLAGFALDLAPDGTIESARLAFGGMAATPKRAAGTEAVLTGRLWDRQTLATARAALARDFAPISDMRADAWYRRTVAANLLIRFYEETAGTASVRLPRGITGREARADV